MRKLTARFVINRAADLEYSVGRHDRHVKALVHQYSTEIVSDEMDDAIDQLVDELQSAIGKQERMIADLRKIQMRKWDHDQRVKQEAEWAAIEAAADGGAE